MRNLGKVMEVIAVYCSTRRQIYALLGGFIYKTYVT